MKLADLNPNWVTTNSYRKGMGLRFNCPHCGEKMVVMFLNPIDGGNPDLFRTDNCKWTRMGETFDTLTLTPSIDIPNHWHGNIINGEALVCS